MALVTAAADLRPSLFPELAGTGEDSRLDLLIAQAEATIAHWLGFPRTDSGVYALEDDTYTFYLPDQQGHGPRRANPRELVLPIRPLVSVTSIYQDSDESHTTLVASTDYLVNEPEKRDGVIRLKQSPACGAWLDGYRNIKVTCVAGWATAPKDLVQAIAWQVQYANTQARSKGAASRTQGGQSTSNDPAAVSSGIDPRAAKLLAPYRLWEHTYG